MSDFVSYLFCLFSLSFTQTEDFCAVTRVFIPGTMASLTCAWFVDILVLVCLEARKQGTENSVMNRNKLHRNARQFD